MKLMIVEDNPLNLKLIQMIIKGLEIDTFYCSNGKEAIDKLPNIQPNLILCDIQMPQVDGIGVLEFVKTHPDLTETKIIAITAHALVGDRERFIRMGFDEYLSKPFDTRQFREIVLAYKEQLVR